MTKEERCFIIFVDVIGIFLPTAPLREHFLINTVVCVL